MPSNVTTLRVRGLRRAWLLYHLLAPLMPVATWLGRREAFSAWAGAVVARPLRVEPSEGGRPGRTTEEPRETT